MSKSSNKKILVSDSAKNIIPCTYCNPKKYLKFCFSFLSYESECSNEFDKIKLLERMRWLSQSPITEMTFKFGRDKDKWFETLPFNEIKKEIPREFRENFPSETNEGYDVFRVYPAGTPNGTANPRIIGMIKHSIFYVFFLDWKGELYNHGHKKQR